MWLTLKMSDNHCQDLIKLLNLDSNGSKTDQPIFDSVQQAAIWKRFFLDKIPI